MPPEPDPTPCPASQRADTPPHVLAEFIDWAFFINERKDRAPGPDGDANPLRVTDVPLAMAASFLGSLIPGPSDAQESLIPVIV